MAEARPNGDRVRLREDWSRRALFALVFLFFYLFHTQIHPVFIFSGDDWTYMSRGREALPSIFEWDPGRIYPETVMPLVADFGLYVVRPFLKDYMTSMTVAYAAFLSVMMTTYVWSVYRLMRSRFRLSGAPSAVAAVLFLFLHYYCFASRDEDNLHLLYIYDLANGFYYMMPILTNLILLLFLEKAERDGSRVYRSPLLKGIFAFFVYIGIFSHIYCSYLLALYCAVRLVEDCLGQARGKGFQAKELVSWAKRRWPYLAVVLMFVVCALMEMSGTRATQMPDRSSAFPMGETLSILAGRLIYIKKKFLLLAAVLLGGALFAARRRGARGSGGADVAGGKGKDAMSAAAGARGIPVESDLLRMILRYLICAALSLIWVILLSTAANPNYVKRMDVLFGPMFFLILAVVSAASYLMLRCPQTVAAVPLALFIGIFSIWSVDGRTFRGDKNPAGWIALENYHIQQFVEADQRGDTKVIMDRTDNYEEDWMGGRIAITLYKHGLVSRRMKVETRREPALKERFHLYPPLLPWAPNG